MNTSYRCTCPITSALDIVGDKWSLVVVKQMLLEGKKTFKEFVESDEAIATNILSSRLKSLEEAGLLYKYKPTHNRKTNFYLLTNKGIGLAPLLIDMVLWSESHLRDTHDTMLQLKPLSFIEKDREAFLKQLVENYKRNEVF